MTFTIKRANGLAIGSWLTMTSAGLISYTADATNVGHNIFTVTATDSKGATFS